MKIKQQGQQMGERQLTANKKALKKLNKLYMQRMAFLRLFIFLFHLYFLPGVCMYTTWMLCMQRPEKGILSNKWL